MRGEISSRSSMQRDSSLGKGELFSHIFITQVTYLCQVIRMLLRRYDVSKTKKGKQQVSRLFKRQVVEEVLSVVQAAQPAAGVLRQAAAVAQDPRVPIMERIEIYMFIFLACSRSKPCFQSSSSLFRKNDAKKMPPPLPMPTSVHQSRRAKSMSRLRRPLPALKVSLHLCCFDD